MNNYLFKIKKRRKYINLEKKNFFFNNVYNKKISKQSIIYKNWINKITSYYIKNGDKKNISKKIKIELIKIYNEIKNQKKIFWVIALNESHQRSDFIVNAFKKKFFSLIKKFYKENKHSSIKNQIKNSKIFQKNINLFNYDIIALNNISKKQKNYNFSKAVSFFISNKTFFWFINAFKSFKKKKNFIDFSWNFNKNIFFSKKYFFSYYIYFLNKKNWIYFYKNPNKKKKIYWNFWVNTNYKFNNKKKIHVYKKNFFFSNKFFFNFKKFKNKKIKKSKIFYKKKISFFYKKNVKFKWFKKSFFIKIFSKYIFFSTITKINKNKIYNYKKYFSNVYNKFQKYNIKKNFIFWWWFFWSIYKKNKSNALNKKKIEKQKIYNKKKKNIKKWEIYKKKISSFNFIFEKNSNFDRWKKFSEKKNYLKKSKLIYSIFNSRINKYYFSVSDRKNSVFYKIKEINLFEEGKYLVVERNYSYASFNNMYFDIIDLTSPFFKTIEQQKKNKKSIFIKYMKKKSINFNERQKVFFCWVKDLIIKNKKYNNLIRNSEKPRKKNKPIKPDRSNRLILPFSPRFFTEFNKIFYFEGELFEKLNEMDEKPFSMKIKKHFRWKI